MVQPSRIDLAVLFAGRRQRDWPDRVRPIKKNGPIRLLNKMCTLWPYPGIAPGGYSIHYTNTNPNPYPGANPG